MNHINRMNRKQLETEIAWREHWLAQAKEAFEADCMNQSRPLKDRLHSLAESIARLRVRYDERFSQERGAAA